MTGALLLVLALVVVLPVLTLLAAGAVCVALGISLGSEAGEGPISTK